MKTKRLMAVTLLGCLGVVTINLAGPAADPAAGKEVFTKKCVSCHGPAGEGKDAIAKMLKTEMRPLGSKEVQAKSDSDLINNIKQGVGKMKPVELKDKEAEDVVAFIRTLKK